MVLSVSFISEMSFCIGDLWRVYDCLLVNCTSDGYKIAYTNQRAIERMVTTMIMSVGRDMWYCQKDWYAFMKVFMNVMRPRRDNVCSRTLYEPPSCPVSMRYCLRINFINFISDIFFEICVIKAFSLSDACRFILEWG